MSYAASDKTFCVSVYVGLATRDYLQLTTFISVGMHWYKTCLSITITSQ